MMLLKNIILIRNLPADELSIWIWSVQMPPWKTNNPHSGLQRESVGQYKHKYHLKCEIVFYVCEDFI